MKSIQKIGFGLVFIALILSFSAQISAASIGVSHGHDLDMLWARAQKEFDLKTHDAILLLEGRHVSILENGNLVTRVHRVVWVGTEVGIEDHADLRIPWNSATSTFTVVALRTWNDGRWWPHESEVSETAVVETLPFALAQADDYTSMRETMLLHDGVELPCIMETIYEIEEQGVAKEGTDDLFVFPQNDPTLLVEYKLTVPATVTPAYRSGNGAPEPEKTTGSDQTMTYTWKMEKVNRLGSPRIGHTVVANYVPHVIWSTWKDWETLGEKIRLSLKEAAVLSETLTDSLSERLRHEPNEMTKIRTVARLVNEWTRSIDYDTSFWQFSPRTATRTWETGYGHALDRAVLAISLYRACGGIGGSLCMSSDLYRREILEIPGLSHFDRIGVLVSGMYFDPTDGSLNREAKALVSGTYWNPCVRTELKTVRSIGGFPVDRSYLNEPKALISEDRSDETGFKHVGGKGGIPAGSFNLVLTLEPGEKDGWIGSGYLEAGGYLCPWEEMSGLNDEAAIYLGKVVGSVLPGASVDGYNPDNFDPHLVAVGFKLKVESGEVDDHGRLNIIIGDPMGGIMSTLPSDVHLYDEDRTSWLDLVGSIVQKVSLRLKTCDREIVYLPESYELRNTEWGDFTLTVKKENDWVTVERKLHLNGYLFPAYWPLLRALLLEELDPAHRTILLK